MKKKYTDKDMMDEINLARDYIKSDIDIYLKLIKCMKEMTEIISANCNSEINALKEADTKLIMRSNTYYRNIKK